MLRSSTPYAKPISFNALLYADPEPEFISFDSEVEPVNLGMKIIEASL